MNFLEDYICANRQMHEQFCVVADVLSWFVQEQARGLSLVRLQRETQKSVAVLRQICIDLTQLRVLRRQVGRGERWVLARDAASITLEDVYDCLILAQGQQPAPASLAAVLKKTPVGELQADRCLNVNIVIMQAAMGINQSIRQHLRHFHLNRVRRDML